MDGDTSHDLESRSAALRHPPRDRDGRDPTHRCDHGDVTPRRKFGDLVRDERSAARTRDTGEQVREHERAQPAPIAS
jgi:hypothetical protein